MLKIIVTGIGGRMGSRIADLVRTTDGMELSGATEAPGSFAIGTTLPEGHPIVDDLEKTIERGDVIIDFTSPKSSLRHAKLAAQFNKGLVLGTTGFNADEKTRLIPLLEKIPSVFASNMSIGVNVMFKVAAQMAKLLGDDYDIEIIEAHHRMKKDSPSGTALTLAEEVAKAVDRNLSNVAVYERHGNIGARKEKEIGIQTIRGGDIVGEHTLLFAGMGECLEIKHLATNRDNFARGAIHAARWLKGKPAGIYNMADVLGLA
jgi:4-hydroxy-tetrahydrodipicolinate reductase